MPSLIETPFLPVHFEGPSLSEGKLPTFFYFALSGEESLTLPPYNHPTLALKNENMRLFSLTIPFHGKGHDKFLAMGKWLESLQKKEHTLPAFFDQAALTIDWLIENGLVNTAHLAFGGLSRGGFIATHLAAREKRVSTLLAFAPLTCLKHLSEYQKMEKTEHFERDLEALDLTHLIPELLHLKHVRFYIGNRDERVGTDHTYHFIKHLAEEAHEKRARQCLVELFILPSIGHKGHGTSPETFDQGALWIKQKLEV